MPSTPKKLPVNPATGGPPPVDFSEASDWLAAFARDLKKTGYAGCVSSDWNDEYAEWLRRGRSVNGDKSRGKWEEKEKHDFPSDLKKEGEHFGPVAEESTRDIFLWTPDPFHERCGADYRDTRYKDAGWRQEIKILGDIRARHHGMQWDTALKIWKEDNRSNYWHTGNMLTVSFTAPEGAASLDDIKIIVTEQWGSSEGHHIHRENFTGWSDAEKQRLTGTQAPQPTVTEYAWKNRQKAFDAATAWIGANSSPGVTARPPSTRAPDRPGAPGPG